jgi:hypothetical protein
MPVIYSDGEYIEVLEQSLHRGPEHQAGIGIADRTYKADIWRRATDAEAATIDAQINAQPIRLRNLFRDCDHLDHADPYFIGLKEGFVEAFGQGRADELLAPSA